MGVIKEWNVVVGAKGRQPGEDNAATIERLKSEYLEYYRDVPNQRLAAGWIGRDEDTIIKWRDADPVFAEAVDKARSDFARTNLRKTRDPKWLLERLLKNEFSTRQELTGPEGGPVQVQTLSDLVVAASDETNPRTDQSSPQRVEK